MADVAPHIRRRHAFLLTIGIDLSCRANCPLHPAIIRHLLAHMVAPLGAAPLCDALTVKTIFGGFAVEQQSIMFSCIAPARAPARLVMPDDLVLETWAISIGGKSEHLVQN